MCGVVDVFVYRLLEDEAVEEEDENGELANFQMLPLPHKSLHGLWEALVYSDSIKDDLLNYVYTAMLFSQRQVNPHIIGWNRVVLLHGPPGTGKTSLCKALAHKLSLRLRRQFSAYDLVEINAHSLFSKWFSESGKLVMKMFSSIREFASDPQQFVCILIDEVESLTAARSKAMQRSEPSDAIRVVNAVLTELDKLKGLPNVLVMTTSNITGAIDEAFLDRADIVQYIGPPGLQARYEILAQCVNELAARGLVVPLSSTSASMDQDTHSTPISMENQVVIPTMSELLSHLGLERETLSPISRVPGALEQALSTSISQILALLANDHDNAHETLHTGKQSVQFSTNLHLHLPSPASSQFKASVKLLESSLHLQGLSGRALRKVPFVATSVVLKGSTSTDAFHFAAAIGEAGKQHVSRKQ